MTDETSKLLPCPFCGGEFDLCENNHGQEYVSHPKADCILSRKILRGLNSVALVNARPTLPDEAELVEIVNTILGTHQTFEGDAIAIITALRPHLSSSNDKARIAELETAMAQSIKIFKVNYNRQTEKLADVPHILRKALKPKDTK